MWEDVLPREMGPDMLQQDDNAEDDAEEGAPHNERRADGERVRDG